MKTSDFSPGLDIRPLNLAARDVPHMTLETNRTCNMRCRLCYNLDRESVKSLDEVKADLDAGLTLRKLSAVSIIGGEPTLYPELPEVIAHVKSHGLFCGLLTNGLRFLDQDGPELIRGLQRAGLDRVFAHVDSGQSHVHPDVEAAREKVFTLLEAARQPFVLSVTIYAGEKDVMAGIIRRYSRFRYFEGILALLGRDQDGQVDSGLDLSGEYRSLRNGLGLEPLSFLPADNSDSDVRWLMYFYVVNAGTGAAFSVSSKVQRFAQKIFRWGVGRQFFGQTMGPAYIRTSLIPIVLAELLFSPRRARELVKLLRAKKGRERGEPTNGKAERGGRARDDGAKGRGEQGGRGRGRGEQRGSGREEETNGRGEPRSGEREEETMARGDQRGGEGRGGEVGGGRKRRLARLRDFRAQFITAQSPPVIDFAARRASVCRYCPDATVRNGKLVPVCIADLVSPLNSTTEAQLTCSM